MGVLNLLSLVIAFAALLISWRTLKVTLESLKTTQSAVERARVDWAKQKWFDLYFKVDQAYDTLEEYQTLYQRCNPAICSLEQEKDHNKLIGMFREVITMASVFPQNSAIDVLFKNMRFTSVNEALSKERLKTLRDALELLRQKALLNRDVLNVMEDDDSGRGA
jgi:hypothetical protein